MKCEDCKWWKIVEDDEKERKILQEDIDRIQKEVTDFHSSDEGKLLDNEPLMKKYSSMLLYEDILNAGWCHRYPPTRQLEDPEGGEIGYAQFGESPKTAKYQYCGEFKEK